MPVSFGTMNATTTPVHIPIMAMIAADMSRSVVVITVIAMKGDAAHEITAPISREATNASTYAIADLTFLLARAYPSISDITNISVSVSATAMSASLYVVAAYALSYVAPCSEVRVEAVKLPCNSHC